MNYIYGALAIVLFLLDAWIYNLLLNKYYRKDISNSFLYGWGALNFVTMWRGILNPRRIFIDAKANEGRLLTLVQLLCEIAVVVFIFLAVL